MNTVLTMAQVDLELDEAAVVTYSVYKQFDCTGEPLLADVLLGAPAPTICSRLGLSNSVAHGAFEVAGPGPERVNIEGIMLSPFTLADSTCLPGTLDKATPCLLQLLPLNASDCP